MAPNVNSTQGSSRSPDAQVFQQSADIVASLPGPIVRLLVIFARPISNLREAVEILSWKAGRRVESWIVVGMWWGLCLGSAHAFKYVT
jgi:hypothetical protein